jgi:hypothetical protein
VTPHHQQFAFIERHLPVSDASERLERIEAARARWVYANVPDPATADAIWQAWTWSVLKPAVSSERAVGNPELIA